MHKELRLKMALHNDTQGKLAKHLGILRHSLNYRLQGRRPFKRDEIKKIMQRYELTAEEVVNIFIL